MTTLASAREKALSARTRELRIPNVKHKSCLTFKA